LKSAGDHGAGQEFGPALVRLKQHHSRRRPLCGNDQTGEPTSGPQIKQMARRRLRLRLRQGDKTLSVEKVPLYGPRTQKTGFASGQKDRMEDVRIGPFLVGGRHRQAPVSRQER